MRDEHPDLIKVIASPERVPMIEVLIDLGFDINAASPGSGTTSLHRAAGSNDLELARILIDLGADPDAIDSYVGVTPLAWAQHSHYDEVADYLRPLTTPDADD